MFSDREKVIVEACVRMVLGQLLDRDSVSISDFKAVLYNLNVGSFGNKSYKFEDTNDWVSCLKDMRSIVEALDPEYRRLCESLGSEYFLLEEEIRKADS